MPSHCRTWIAGALWAACQVAGAAPPPAPPASPPPCAEPLRLGFNDSPFPPLLYGSGEKFVESEPGWNVTVAREAAQRLGCRVEAVRLPTRRLIAMLERGELDFAFLFGPTPERLRALRFPLDAAGRPDPAFAIVVGHLTLVTLRGNEARVGWDGHAPRADARVGTVTGTAQAAYALAHGWSTEPISSVDSVVPMLRGRRFDAVLLTREALTEAQLAGADALVELQPEVDRLYFYAPSSLALQARNEGLVWRYWRELCVGSRKYLSQGLPACGTR
jgi:hypothetical protein